VGVWVGGDTQIKTCGGWCREINLVAHRRGVVKRLGYLVYT